MFIGYCRQSAGYIFYIPHKHQVVSRRDAHFNQAYFPARVGETMLIDRNTIKTENSNDKNEMALPDGNGHHQNSIKNNDENSSKNIQNSNKNIQNSDKSIQNGSKNDENSDYDDIESNTEPARNSDVARKLQSKFNKLFNKSDKAAKPLSSGAKDPPKTSPDIEENLKLLLDHDSIIRASTKIENAAPHIYERANKADGISVSEALKISYKHKDHPGDVFMYKMKDIKYDIQKRWG